jgi:hypothetical protein
VLPRVEAGVSDRDISAQERDEHRDRGVEPQPAGLHEVSELVHQNEQDEADCKTPAPEQRVAADGDEDRGQLEDAEAELGDEADQDKDRCEKAAKEGAPIRARMDRLVVSQLAGCRLHAPTVARPAASPGLQDPLPIHSSPPS